MNDPQGFIDRTREQMAEMQEPLINRNRPIRNTEPILAELQKITALLERLVTE